MRWSTTSVVALFVVVDVGVVGAAYALSHRGNDATASDVPSVSASAPAGLGGTASPSANASTTPPDWTGPLFLTASASGRLARVTRGSCDARQPVRSRVWLTASFRAPLKEVQVPGLQESLGVVVGDDDVTIVGAGPRCTMFGFVSDDDGATWRKGAVPRQAWYLDRDTTQSVIHGPVPGGEQNLDCVPVSVTTLGGGGEALVSCENQDVMDLSVRAGEPAASRSYAATGPVGVAVVPDRSRYVLGKTDRCTAAVVRADTEVPPRQIACLGRDDAPLGLAASGSRIFAQVGYRLLLSTDAGKTFRRYPGDAGT